jgi:hypothetical protein
VILVRKPEGKISLGRPSCTVEDYIKKDLHFMGYTDVDLIYLARDRVQW